MLAQLFVTLALSGPAIAADSQQPDVTVQVPQAQPPEAQPPDPQTAPQPPPEEPQDPKDQRRDAKEPPTPPHTGVKALFFNLGEDIRHLPSKQNLLLVGIGGGLAAAAHPADQGTNARLRSHYDGVNKAFAAGKYIGNTPEQIGLSLATFVYGRIFHAPKVSHLGNDLLQAQILTEMLVQPIKFSARRERPDASNARSFPSGHAAITFAGATVLERHLGWRKSLIGYTIASYVAASRLHDNRHYLSDVVFGAAIGSIAGRTVVHHSSDYWVFTPAGVPGGGVAVLATRTFGQ
jgi:hypothetical protein